MMVNFHIILVKTTRRDSVLQHTFPKAVVCFQKAVMQFGSPHEPRPLPALFMVVVVVMLILAVSVVVVSAGNW